MFSTSVSFIAPTLGWRRAAGRRNGVGMCVANGASSDDLRQVTRDWGLTLDPDDRHRAHLSVEHAEPAMLRHAALLSRAQCDALIAGQVGAKDEASLYLNYRVNRQVREHTVSSEAAALIAANADASASAMQPSMRSGFRTQVHPDSPALQPLLRVLRDLLGWRSRAYAFADGAWTRPNRRQVVVRDVTTVRYVHGEGVAPHVDGKDLTVLVCLRAPSAGGRTVFPDEDVKAVPVVGQGLIYSSNKHMLHFAEPVEDGEKWVLQLLIDHRVREDEMDIDFASGQVYQE